MDYECVTRVRPGASVVNDRYGKPIPGPDADVTIGGCLVAPASSSEPVGVGRLAVITQDTIYMPPGTDVVAGDRLVVRGKTFTVEGDPSDWSGGPGGVAVAVKRVDG